MTGRVQPDSDVELDKIQSVPSHQVGSQLWENSGHFTGTSEFICRSMFPWDLRKHFNHAVREGDHHFVQIALNVKPNLINNLDDYLLSPLCYAIKYFQHSMLKCLLLRGAQVNQRCHAGIRPIHLTAVFNNTEAVQLLAVNTHIKIDVTDDKGQSALHVACRRNQVEIVQLLLKYGADHGKREKDGTTVLHQPARNGKTQLCQLLLNHCNPQIVWKADNNGISPLMAACIEGKITIIKMFLSKGASIVSPKREHSKHPKLGNSIMLNQTDNDGATCLHHATINKHGTVEQHVQILGLLIESGAHIDARRNDGNTSLHIAASLGHEEVVACLLLRGASPNVVDERNRTPLHECALANQPSIAEKLISLGSNVDAADNNFMTSLHWACRKGHLQVLHVLLRYNVRVDNHDVSMRTCLHWAVLGEHVECVDAILAYSTSFDIVNKQDMYDRTVLHYAAEQGNWEIVNKLVQSGADCSIADSDERRPSHLTAKAGQLQCLEMLIQKSHHSGESMQPRDIDESTSLLLAAEAGHYHIFEYLCGTGADFSAKDDVGRNSLMLACSKGHFKIVQYLLDKDIDINITDSNRSTALHYAAKEGDIDGKCVQMLIEYGAQLTENNSLDTPVDFAVMTNNESALNVFFGEENYRWTMSFRRSNGHTHMDRLIELAPDIAKKILDRSLSTSSDDKIDKNFAIIYNFTFLDPGPDDPASAIQRYCALKKMASEQKEELLSHPLSSALIQMKWHLFGKFFFLVDLVFYLLFLACLTAFVVDQGPLKPSEMDELGCRIVSGNSTSSGRQKLTNISVIIEKSVITATLGIRVIGEIIKIIHKKHRYFMIREVYFYLILYAVTAAFVYPPDSEPCLWNWLFGVASVILAWCMLLFQIENIPTTGIYALMFERVFLSLVKVLAMFAFFIMGFALAFYISMKKSTPFTSFGGSLLKTIDMTMGELEYVTYFVSEDYGVFHTYVEFVFVFFCVMMPIALMNLLVGIAVGDIDGIKREASLRLLSIRIDFLYEIEISMPSAFQRRLFKPFYEIYPNRDKNILQKLTSGTYEDDYKEYLANNKFNEDQDNSDNNELCKRMQKLEETVETMSIKTDQILNLLQNTR